MNKFILTVILTAFASVYSLGAVAADNMDKSDNATHESQKEKWEKEYGETGKGNTDTSEIMQNEEAKDIPEGEKYKYREQEDMNKKPYKQSE